jgi:antitoxin component YwqK of YwqJK toxin-antitoxin module
MLTFVRIKYFFMRHVLVFIFFTFSVVVFSQPTGQNINPNGYNKFYYDNGVLSSEGTMRDGKPDGYWKTYSPNGKLKSEGNRKNYLLDSTWKFYNDQAKLAFEFAYREGKKNGPKKTFDTKEGFLISAENYENDLKQGNSFVYYPNGKVKQIIPFVDNKEEGVGYELTADSTIITITQYKMGFIQREERINRKDANGLKQGMWKEFYPSGVVKTEVTYTDDKMNGYLKEYSPKGSLLNTTKYILGVLQTNAPELAKVDVKTGYYENGKVRFTAIYRDGVAEGIHREFDEEGNVKSAKIYVEGILTAEGILDTAGRQQGVWKEYYPGGQLKSQGEYLNSVRIGEWVFYHQNGKIEQRGKYDKKGKAQGAWKWYYESGNLLREENYLNNKQDGIMTEYDDSANVITKGEFIDGLKEGPWFLQIQNHREEGNYKAGVMDGEWKHYYINSNKLRFIGKFIDGVPDGMQTYYYENGKKRQEGKYAGGMKEGDWYFYDENGFIFLTITYKSDVEIKFDGIKITPETPTSEPSIR